MNGQRHDKEASGGTGCPGTRLCSDRGFRADGVVYADDTHLTHGKHNWHEVMMKTQDKLANPREIRRRLGLNQQQFWGMIGVTQSGGSRYESGRSMPKPVMQLLRLVHIDRIDPARITRADFEVISFLKAAKPDLYKRLRTEASGASARPPRPVAVASARRTAPVARHA
jgi:DNA-binding transcriptional regulator YiaG